MNTKHLKAKILDLAIRGKLVPQDSSEGNATDLLQKIRYEKTELIKKKKIKEDKNASYIIKADDVKYYEQFADGTLKDIDDEIPFVIPESWCWCRLSEIANSIIAGGDRPAICTKEKTSENTIPIYANAVEKDGLYGYTNKPQITEKSITISARGTIGFSCIREHPFVPIVRLIVLVPNLSIIDLKYLKAAFDALLNMTEGSSIPQLTIPSIKTFLFPLPPLSEQQRIVNTIEKAFEQIEIIEKNKLNLKTYIKQTKNKVLDLAIHGKLVEQNPKEGNATDLLQKVREGKAELIKQKKIKEDKKASYIIKADDGKYYEQFYDGTLKDIDEEIPFKIPENWCWCRLPELCSKISDGTHKTPTYVDSGIPFLSVQNISKGYFDLSVIKYITSEEHNELCKRIKPEKDDILICRIGTLGRAIRNNLDFEFSIFVSLGIIRLLSPDLVDYVITALNSNYGTNWIDDNKVQGSHTNKINLETFPKLFIPIPPLEEQKRIVDKIENIFAQLEILEKSLGE